jgi:hypothetical protein
MQQKLVSIVIIAILGAQSLVVLFPLWSPSINVFFDTGPLTFKHMKGRLWPFIDYPMYSQIHREGDRLDVYYPVFAAFEDETEKQLAPNDLGLSLFKYQDVFVSAIFCAATGALPIARRECKPAEGDRVKELLRDYQGRVGQRVVRLRVEDYPLIFTKDGPVKAPARTLQVLDLD